MKRSLIFSVSLILSISIEAQVSSENYIIKSIPTEPVKDLVEFDALPSDQKRQQIEYVDGFGRIIQRISVDFTPGKDELITFFDYELNGSIEKHYLSFAKETGLNLLTSPALDAEDYYSDYNDISITDRPFTEFGYSESPMNVVDNIIHPGEPWQDASHHEKIVSIGSQGYQVVEFDYTSSGIFYVGYYDANELFLRQHIDEDGLRNRYFETSSGKIISIWRDNINSSDPIIKTYFVYDDFGRVKLILQPQGFKELFDGDFSVPLNEDFLFKYEYDKYDRVVEKKVPSKEVEYFVYNDRGDIVLSQDGLLRDNRDWRFYKYDYLGRELYNGIYHHGAAITRGAMKSLYESNSIRQFEKRTSQFMLAPAVFGYTNDVFPTSNFEYWEAFYYDHYDFYNTNSTLGTLIENYLAAFSTLPYEVSEYDKYPENILYNYPERFPKGQITKKIYGVIEGEQNIPKYLDELYFYDFEGKLIRVVKEDFQDLGQGLETKTIENYYFDFHNRLKHETIDHRIGSSYSQQVKKKYTYDHQDRLEHVFQKNGSDNPVLLKQVKYNDIGNVKEENLHSFTAGKFLQSVDYRYNIRNWLTHINNVNFGTDYEGDISFDPSKVVVNYQIEKININVVEYTDGNGVIQRRLQLDNVKVLNVENVYGGTGSQGSQTVRPGATAFDVQVWNTLGDIMVEPIILEFGLLTIDQGYDIDDLIDLAKIKLNTELQNRGITHNGSISFLNDNVEGFIATSLGEIYFKNEISDLWAQRIRYNDKTTRINNEPGQYNGKPSEIHWKNINNPRIEGYALQYDGHDRLTQAVYMERSSNSVGFNHEVNRYSTGNLTYDLNGNILSLERHGSVTGLYPIEFMKVDDLTYSYDGNRLLSVSDFIPSTIGVDDFKDVNPLTSDDYSYDENGNLTADNHKELTIQYNYLNLPTRVTHDNGDQVNYTYTSSGALLKKELTLSSSIVSTDIHEGMFHYVDGALSYFDHEAGRIVINTNPLASSDEFLYEYVYMDHLGSARLRYADLDFDELITPSTEVLEINDYYAFGGKHVNSSDVIVGPESNNKFHDKRLHTDLGLKWYEYPARFYDPQIARWTGIDILSEKYQTHSPYNFVFNNPFQLIDPTGMEPEKEDPKKRGGFLGKLVQSINSFFSAVFKISDSDTSADYFVQLRAVEITAEGTKESESDQKEDDSNVEMMTFSFGTGPKFKGGFWETLDRINNLGQREWYNPDNGLTLYIDDDGNVTGLVPHYGVAPVPGRFSKFRIPKGFKEVKNFGYPHGQKVYKFNGKYYSKDITGHTPGGVWKVFEKVGKRLKRIGTADKNLNIFKK